MLRNHRNASRDRASFVAFVAEHSDASRNVHVVDPQTGSELTLYRSRTGHVLGEAVYPATGRALYRVKVAHAVAAMLVGASLAFGTAQAASAASKADPFPVAAVAEEIGPQVGFPYPAISTFGRAAPAAVHNRRNARHAKHHGGLRMRRRHSVSVALRGER